MPPSALERMSVVVPLVALGVAACASTSEERVNDAPQCAAAVSDAPAPAPRYPEHTNVVASVFWVGEGESTDNGFIQNRASAWDDDWVGRFGGEDGPDGRSGYCPADFTPKENGFYVALPYNDIDGNGARRAEAASTIPWFAASESAAAADGGAGPTAGGRLKSVLEHRWVEVSAAGRRCYGQWEDVGPFLEDDAAFVFGTAPARNTVGLKAGIDLSPALATCLRINGAGTVSWRFVEASDVTDGPWRVVVTAPR